LEDSGLYLGEEATVRLERLAVRRLLRIVAVGEIPALVLATVLCAP